MHNYAPHPILALSYIIHYYMLNNSHFRHNCFLQAPECVLIWKLTNYNANFLLRLWLLSCWCLAKPMRQELRWIEAWDFGFPSTLPGLPMGRESRPTWATTPGSHLSKYFSTWSGSTQLQRFLTSSLRKIMRYRTWTFTRILCPQVVAAWYLHGWLNYLRNDPDFHGNVRHYLKR